jgi:hypothetical protein
MTSEFECEDVLEAMVVFCLWKKVVNITLKEKTETRSEMFVVNCHET